MNARERLIEVIGACDRQEAEDHEVWEDMADAVLAVLPALLLRPEIVEAAAQGMNASTITYATRRRAGLALNAAVDALIDQAES